MIDILDRNLPISGLFGQVPINIETDPFADGDVEEFQPALEYVVGNVERSEPGLNVVILVILIRNINRRYG